MASQLSTKVIEIAGRNWLAAQCLLHGLQVATPDVDLGIDLIVFKEVGMPQGIKALPLQLKCFSDERFSLDSKYADRGITMAYIWNVLREPVVYFIDYEVCLELLGGRRQSISWSRGAYSTKISVELRHQMEPYLGQWEWLEKRLGAEPLSR